MVCYFLVVGLGNDVVEGLYFMEKAVKGGDLGGFFLLDFGLERYTQRGVLDEIFVMEKLVGF